jgi:orotidine-5'-phosphate decarboxylase
MADQHIFDRVVSRCRELGSAVCVGLDPHLDLLPDSLPGRDEIDRCRNFLFAILEALDGVVPVVKPQIAFFEQLGPDGVALYFDVIRRAHRHGFLVIGDIKRGDIGSTAQAYARAHLGADDGGAADWVTLSPYLGFDSIRPFLELGRSRDRGVFVLTRTSNPTSDEIQALDAGGAPLHRHVGRLVESWGSANVGESGYGDAGAVVGATHPEEARALRRELPRTFFLVPGYGAQGGSAEDVAGTFDGDGSGALISASRSVLFAYRNQPDKDRRFAEAAREAAFEMSAEIAAAVDADRPGTDAEGPAAAPA